MGFLDRLRGFFGVGQQPSPPSFEEREAEAQEGLAADYAETVTEDISAALTALDEEHEPAAPTISIDATPEYDAGGAQADDLLAEEAMASHYGVNTAETPDLEDADEHLVSAKVVGDLPEVTDQD